MVLLDVVDWMEADLNVSLQSIVRKRQNDWRSPVYIAREKFVVFTSRLSYDILIQSYKVKNETDAELSTKINNMHFIFSFHFMLTLNSLRRIFTFFVISSQRWCKVQRSRHRKPWNSMRAFPLCHSFAWFSLPMWESHVWMCPSFSP